MSLLCTNSAAKEYKLNITLSIWITEKSIGLNGKLVSIQDFVGMQLTVVQRAG